MSGPARPSASRPHDTSRSNLKEIGSRSRSHDRLDCFFMGRGRLSRVVPVVGAEAKHCSLWTVVAYAPFSVHSTGSENQPARKLPALPEPVPTAVTPNTGSPGLRQKFSLRLKKRNESSPLTSRHGKSKKGMVSPACQALEAGNINVLDDLLTSGDVDPNEYVSPVSALWPSSSTP